jgi:hypothetical protein
MKKLNKKNNNNNQLILDFIIKNKLYYGDIAECFLSQKGFNEHVWLYDEFYRLEYFNIYEQVRLLNRVRLVIQSSKLKKDSIFLFGVNPSNYDVEDYGKLFDINLEIFKSSLSLVNDSEIKKKSLNKFLSKFLFNKGYDFKSIGSYSSGIKALNKLNKLANRLKSIGILRSSRIFIPYWGYGYFSNYRFLKAVIRATIRFQAVSFFKKIEEDFFEESVFIRNIKQFQYVNAVKKILKRRKEFPDVAIILSPVGYDSYFAECRRLGIPIICIIGKEERDVFNDIDYPLIGDCSDCTVLLSYIKILNHFLNNK